MCKKNSSFFLGAAISLLANWLFYINHPASKISQLQINVLFTFPFVLLLPMLLIGALTKGFLLNDIEPGQCDITEANNISRKNSSFFHRFLARSYLIIIYPGIFVTGWVSATALFFISVKR